MKTKAKAKAAAKKRRPEKPVAEVSAPKAEYSRERREISVDLLMVAPWNPRGKITPESVADLVSSIKSLGVIQPLVAMLGSNGWATLIAGHRRLAAAKIAGLKSVPCDILRGVDEATAKRMTFIENLQRKDADPLLESGLVGSLVASGMTQDEIAAETGRGREWVARRMNLSRLSKSWRKRVKDGEKITTDCLEHVAAFSDEVQERLKNATNYNSSGGALRWSDVKGQFDHETQNLANAEFDRTPCKTCRHNTGCSPELFDWDKKPSTFGKCMDAKCFKRKAEEAVKAKVAAAKESGKKVKECGDHHPDYSIDLRDNPDEKHDTLYVWKDYSGDTVSKWGESPKVGQAGGGMTRKQKNERRRKIAANKARRKLAEWCMGGGLAKAIAEHYTPTPSVVRAFQDAFRIGSYYYLFGSNTDNRDLAIRVLSSGDGDVAPESWDAKAADAIGTSLTGCMGEGNAEILCALFIEARQALTDEELALVASQERIDKILGRGPVKWIEDGGSSDAKDDADGCDGEGETEGEE